MSSENSHVMRGAKSERTVEIALARDGVIRRGEHVVVACSGGPDSVALAAILAAVARRLALRLTLAHVNHGLRPSAWQDEAVVLRVSAALGLSVRIARLATARADEATLRDVRYGALLEIAREVGAGAVATAHTAEDQTETLLLALFRGTGAQGLAGIAARRELGSGVTLCRPLLRWKHASLCEYCQVRALPYALDPSNGDPAYRRNAVRAALDSLRPAFPGLDAAVSRTAHLISAELAGGDRADLRQRVRKVLRENDALRDVDFEHVEAAVRALEANRSGTFYMNAEADLTITSGEISVRRPR